MNRELIILPAADGDVDECFSYLQDESSLDTALRFLTALQHSFERIRRMPFIGSPRSFRSSELHNLRQWPVKDFADILIFYAVTKKSVEVYRVLHTRRDIETLFNEKS